MTPQAREAAACVGETARPWRRGLGWLCLLGPFFFISYAFANWLASQRDHVGSIVFEWEYNIPFLPWSIVPYWLIDALYALSLFVPRERAELDGHARRLLAAQVISVTCFILFPLTFTFERPPTSGVFGWMFDVLLGFDKPFNQAPSLHISLLVILWTLYARHACGFALWALRVTAVLIGVSVLTTFQHHFIDIPTGVLVGAMCVLVFPLDRQAVIRQRDARRTIYTARYAGAAAVLAVPALWLGGAWLWLLWPACALLSVAGIYWHGDPRLFRKRDGRMDEAVAVLLAPYLVGAWINTRLWTRRRPAPSAIMPDLFLSRLPSPAEFAALDPRALVDCCAELPYAAGERPVFAVPMLDLLAPEVSQIEQAVAAIAAARRHGRTLVFCALGYSRSAVAVIAWLVAEGYAATLEDANTLVVRMRPALALSPGHWRQLEAWQTSRSADGR